VSLLLTTRVGQHGRVARYERNHCECSNRIAYTRDVQQLIRRAKRVVPHSLEIVPIMLD
jgi:hypothetical protein